MIMMVVVSGKPYDYGCGIQHVVVEEDANKRTLKSGIVPCIEEERALVGGQIRSKACRVLNESIHFYNYGTRALS